MTTMRVTSDVREAKLSAVVTAGPETAARLGVPVGTQFDLGELAYYHRNPLRRVLRRVTKKG